MKFFKLIFTFLGNLFKPAEPHIDTGKIPPIEELREKYKDVMENEAVKSVSDWYVRGPDNPPPGIKNIYPYSRDNMTSIEYFEMMIKHDPNFVDPAGITRELVEKFKQKGDEMQLSKNFSLAELTKSQTATRKGIDNTPTKDHLTSIKILVSNLLQPIRDDLGKPIRITSCYRSPELNKAVGSSSKSQHTKGEAADFEVTGMDNYELAKYISENHEFDQLILEFYDKEEGPNTGWVHCSYKWNNNRNEILTAKRIDGKVKYFNGFYL